MTYKTVRGTRDILPGESSEWQGIENASRGVLRLFGYSEIRTPVIEETALFVKSVGEDTDIVKKEMFSFQDRGERNISLRPEGTAPIVRAYLEHSLAKIEPFQKLFYIGPMFRAERPQAGRLRQFHQIGLEAIGSDHPALDAEVISVLTNILDATGIKDYRLKLNNLGCREDKAGLSKLLKEIFSDHALSVRLCEDCKRRAKTNPLRLLDCKNESCKLIIREYFKKTEFLCDACKGHFDKVQEFLKLLKIAYEIDPYIVRGLDYYTRTVFEVLHKDLGSQDAIGAGGRYDDLISDMGGPKLGAAGFALGMDRMILALGEGRAGAFKSGIALFVATVGKASYAKAFTLLNELRSGGVACDIDYKESSLKSQMRTADKLGAKFVLIIGDDEVAKGEAVLRNMVTKEQVNVKFSDIVSTVKGKLC